MKITRTQLKEMIREELMLEEKKVHAANIEGHKLQINLNEDNGLVNIKVVTPDGYTWNIERIPVSVATELKKGLSKL